MVFSASDLVLINFYYKNLQKAASFKRALLSFAQKLSTNEPILIADAEMNSPKTAILDRHLV